MTTLTIRELLAQLTRAEANVRMLGEMQMPVDF